MLATNPCAVWTKNDSSTAAVLNLHKHMKGVSYSKVTCMCGVRASSTALECPTQLVQMACVHKITFVTGQSSWILPFRSFAMCCTTSSSERSSSTYGSPLTRAWPTAHGERLMPMATNCMPSAGAKVACAHEVDWQVCQQHGY